MECEMPSPLICQILSYLPICDSAKTSILSKKCELLWLEAAEFDLTTVKSSKLGKALMCLMNKFMALNRSSCLQNFKIKYGNSCYPQKESNIISFKGCFGYAEEEKKIQYYYTIDCNKRILLLIAELVHRGVQHLDVEMYQDAKDLMPKNIYMSKSLVDLKLVNVRLEDPKFPVSLPSLKTLHLENITYEGDFGGNVVIKKFIAASPILEDLTFDLPEPSNLWYPPQSECLKSTLEYVKIMKLILMEGTWITLYSYFLENSAVLKELTLSFIPPFVYLTEEQEIELTNYVNHITSRKLSPTCQVFFECCIT